MSLCQDSKSQVQGERTPIAHGSHRCSDSNTTDIDRLVLLRRYNPDLLLRRLDLHHPKPSGNRIEHTAEEQRHQGGRHDDDIVRHAEVGRRQVQQQLGAAYPQFGGFPERRAVGIPFSPLCKIL
jgi:hypothetical protein